ncbi:major facilitator superfamily domain-containing protein [Bisporella sp. PMI_857]|nr:major facilitator superfamily domain-containing protein [Bisporella sp. PMI_857]
MVDNIAPEDNQHSLAPKPAPENDLEHDVEKNIVGTADKPSESRAEGSELEVWWNDDKDPANPQNWTARKKWSNIAVLSSITFLTPLASSMFAPGIAKVLAEFNSDSNTDATFVVSIFVLGFAFGPLLLAPLSELYGRLPVYHTCNVAFVICTVLCATAQNMDMLMAFRFLAGFAGVATITCGGGTIVDMMPPEQRGGAMAIWSLGPLLGPIIGPVAGGFLIEAAGWRWVFWLITIAAGVITVIAFLVMSETYPVILLERKAAILRKETGNLAYRSKLASDLTPRQLMTQSIIRPLNMLFRSPIVSAMCIYIAVMYGLLYILFTTFSFVFIGVYNFSTAAAGLAFLGSGVGMLLGLVFVGGLSDRNLKKQIAIGKVAKPEDRLPFFLTVPACLSLPCGLFIYGWGAEKHVHWMVPQVGTAVIGFGMIGIMMCIQTYLVDAFPRHAASVTAANAVLRSLLGALVPLGGLDLYDKLGLGWGNSLLGFIALALAPIPVVFAVFGERIRTSPKARVIL